jgi:hypothetical protein
MSFCCLSKFLENDLGHAHNFGVRCVKFGTFLSPWVLVYLEGLETYLWFYENLVGFIKNHNNVKMGKFCVFLLNFGIFPEFLMNFRKSQIKLTTPYRFSTLQIFVSILINSQKTTNKFPVPCFIPLARNVG